MESSPFKIRFSDLPDEIPIFPLPGVTVMPGVLMPLNIFEPRYLSMVFEVLRTHRMIGMVQPYEDQVEESTPSVYQTGTAGRISSFSETRDGRLMIVLSGVCRFDIRRELEQAAGGFRLVEADWSRFAIDYEDTDIDTLDRGPFFAALRSYCELKSVDIEWKEAKQLSDRELIDLLTVHLPLGIADKQALIETIPLNKRIQLLQGLIHMSNTQAEPPGGGLRH